MNTMPRNASRQTGFSMVELMIALVLGVILTSGVISVYITSKKTYSLNNAVGQVQESGRFALSYIEPPVRMAGFTGCTHATGTSFYNHLNGGSNASFNLANGVQGYEANTTGIGGSFTVTTAAANNVTKWTPNLPSDISTAIGGSGTGAAIAGNDILVLHEASNNAFALVSPYQDSAGVFVTSASAAQLANGELAVMTDCSKASLFQITNVSTSSGRVDHSSASYTPGNTGPVWSETYGAGAQLMFLTTYVFYIGVGVDGSPSLYMVNLGSTSTTAALATPQELVSGVENMQILYGVDTDTDKIPNDFQTADTVDAANNWPNVVSVRIALLTRSDDSSTEKAPAAAPTFILMGNSSTDATNGVTITVAKDRRLRRTFAETISIRNSLP
jgi:type IV pilus assembly protein PilW